MRKQKHLGDLTAQISQLMKENEQIITNINVTTQHYMNMEAENSVLRARVGELSHRLQSLNEIITVLDSTSGAFGAGDFCNFSEVNDSFMNPWNMVYPHQTVMASADILHY